LKENSKEHFFSNTLKKNRRVLHPRLKTCMCGRHARAAVDGGAVLLGSLVRVCCWAHITLLLLCHYHI
jgi:hypothetical protein